MVCSISWQLRERPAPRADCVSGTGAVFSLLKDWRRAVPGCLTVLGNWHISTRLWRLPSSVSIVLDAVRWAGVTHRASLERWSSFSSGIMGEDHLSGVQASHTQNSVCYTDRMIDAMWHRDVLFNCSCFPTWFVFDLQHLLACQLDK